MGSPPPGGGHCCLKGQPPPGEQQQSQRGTVPGPSFDLVPKHFRGRGCPQLRPPPTHCHSHAISWRAGGSGRAWLQGGDPVKHLTGGLGYCLYWVYPRWRQAAPGETCPPARLTTQRRETEQPPRPPRTWTRFWREAGWGHSKALRNPHISVLKQDQKMRSGSNSGRPVSPLAWPTAVHTSVWGRLT